VGERRKRPKEWVVESKEAKTYGRGGGKKHLLRLRAQGEFRKNQEFVLRQNCNLVFARSLKSCVPWPYVLCRFLPRGASDCMTVLRGGREG